MVYYTYELNQLNQTKKAEKLLYLINELTALKGKTPILFHFDIFMSFFTYTEEDHSEVLEFLVNFKILDIKVLHFFLIFNLFLFLIFIS